MDALFFQDWFEVHRLQATVTGCLTTMAGCASARTGGACMVAGTALPGEQGGAHAQAGARIQGCRVGTQVGIDLRLDVELQIELRFGLDAEFVQGTRKLLFRGY